MALELITPPTTVPVSVAEMAADLRVDHGDDNAMIEQYIREETEYLDAYKGILGRALMPQVWELTYDRFPCAGIRIWLPPVISVDSVKYDDIDGNEQTVASTDYELDFISPFTWVVPASTFTWPTTFEGINAVRVRFTAGYPIVSGETTVPAPLRAAIKLRVRSRYDGEPLSDAYQALITPYRVHALG